MFSSEAKSTFFIPETPYHVVWLATNACTARCLHCSSNSAKCAPDELSTEEAKKLIDQLVEAGVVDFGISGGEPLLRRDMMEILGHAKAAGMTVGIATNGAKLTRKRAAELAELGLDRLQASLDGFAQEHDRLRCWPGLFDRVLKTICVAREVGLRVHVCCTVNALNCGSLEAFTDFVAGIGVKRLNLSRYVPTGRGTAILDPGDGAWRDLIARCAALKVQYVDRLEITTHLAQEVMFDPYVREMPTFSGCQAGRGQGCVTANGTILPCVLLPVAVGNVREGPFRDIWTQSETIRALQDRSSLGGSCVSCSLRERCGGCRAVAYARTGDMFAADPRCWIDGPVGGICVH